MNPFDATEEADHDDDDDDDEWMNARAVQIP